MKQKAFAAYRERVNELLESGAYKDERVLTTPQDARINTTKMRNVLNMCSNNYLGLASDPEIIAVAKESLDRWGNGLAAARFICGTQSLHKELEAKIANFFEMDDAILYPTCSAANGGLFESLLGPEDAIISDELNHASIIDGIRLCKAKRFRYKNNDMEDLREKLDMAKGARYRLIATDGVFSMDGYIANLQGICDLAEEYGAMVMVDDCHAIGIVGDHGKGTTAYCKVMGRVDIITGTLAKALGSPAGGFVSAKQEIVDLLRQVSRSYIFTNSVAPIICAVGLHVLDLLERSPHLQDAVKKNTAYFRNALTENNFDVLPGEHPIVPIMLYDAQVARDFSANMLNKGVYVVGLSFPVVPQGQARIRAQVSAAHTKEDLDFAVKCFCDVRNEMGL
ncbi:MAG TPA: glycine C-acetyltransferase [Bacillota bacterium]|jgi:glycine C-acetyltransferase|nr:glycine C-acetyltransferase [Fastidiosipila sp.]HPX93774.1 glycine C-acetyltransferase [Bacillota bacterium]HQB81599.1 glycine C-acetyltransferase [Bacillota bacterium]